MKNIKKNLIVFSLVLIGILTLNLSEVTAAEKGRVEPQPRIYVSDVLSFYDTQITFEGIYKHEFDYNYNYRTIQYINGYNYTTKTKYISNLFESLAGIDIYRTTYTYSTY